MIKRTAEEISKNIKINASKIKLINGYLIHLGTFLLLLSSKPPSNIKSNNNYSDNILFVYYKRH